MAADIFQGWCRGILATLKMRTSIPQGLSLVQGSKENVHGGVNKFWKTKYIPYINFWIIPSIVSSTNDTGDSRIIPLDQSALPARTLCRDIRWQTQRARWTWASSWRDHRGCRKRFGRKSARLEQTLKYRTRYNIIWPCSISRKHCFIKTTYYSGVYMQILK